MEVFLLDGQRHFMTFFISFPIRRDKSDLMGPLRKESEEFVPPQGSNGRISHGLRIYRAHARHRHRSVRFAFSCQILNQHSLTKRDIQTLTMEKPNPGIMISMDVISFDTVNDWPPLCGKGTTENREWNFRKGLLRLAAYLNDALCFLQLMRN
ncbi:hypothetical protein CEXT_47401 [Caerostris extrusa]|uniref:Uncharacterized protein n=1 Tax=Caerostris extrusa TaxID=172846 RepID=A0AAV4VK52_CAEEX|nr:hypothetical protein CEXT_47401 [Caerostris extrusa]